MRVLMSDLKRMIEEAAVPPERFIFLVREDGRILSANSRMIRSLHLSSPRLSEQNLFEMIHPVNLSAFRQLIQEAGESPVAGTLEIFLKNGLYHPMKWHIRTVAHAENSRVFLCVGHKLLDERRAYQFHQLGEKNYQLIFESLDAGILFQDQNGEIIAVNQKTAEILNVTLERLYQLKHIAKQWDHNWTIRTESGEIVTFEQTPFAKAISTRQRQTDVLVIHLRDGQKRWLHFSSQPLFRDHSSIPFAVVSNITDLTMERKLIRELRERKAILRSFMKKTPNLAWVVDEAGQLVFASKNFFEFFRIQEADSLQRNILELVPRSLAEELMLKHQRVLETGETVEAIQRINWADGSEFIFHIDIFLIEGISGKKIIGGHAVNLTDKFSAENKLRATNDRLLLLSRATTDAIWEWDMQTGQIFRNEALMELVGYQAGEPKGLSWWLRRIHPDDRNRVGETVRQQSEKGKLSWQEEYRFKCADGMYKPIRDRGYIVYENGLPVKMIGSIQDVSNLKSLETRLVEERLTAQKEISEMVIQAQEKERTQIGHELHDNVNQILSSAKLFFEMLQAEGADQALYKSKGIEYISLAVEEIRKLSRELVAPGLREKDLIPCIGRLLEDTRMASRLDIHFTHELDPDLLADGKKVTIFRILQEQIKNILKHSGASRIDISLIQETNQVRMTVKDNGMGFDANQTFRGIGLSGIFERIRYYEGTADIDTAVGKGCLLTVTIPL
ncbi:MAG: PAS domain S-box protein [Chitinophagales bacterium]|nr:PAS domain S-box protein [Chitinophagales bacterium]